MNTDAAIPERLAGYTLVREAGRGAMSTVYEARDGKDRRVALKMLHAPATLAAEQQRALIERLDREARVMLRLSHPNVVRLFDVGQQAGEHFIVMEYLDGQTLRARLDGGPLSLAEASRLLDQAAAALDAVHAEGIIHRDVKPSNIMLVGDGIVKLMDFGVARQGDDTTITQTGMIVGSPAYMSPEQVRGDENTPSTDLWALGILLYEMLAGHSPFTGSNVSTVLYRVAHETPAPVPGLSNAVQQILRRALDKNPARRYRTGRALADAFRSAVLGPAVQPLPPARQRPRWPWVAAPVAAMFALLVGAVFFTRSHPHGTIRPLGPATPFYASPNVKRPHTKQAAGHARKMMSHSPGAATSLMTPHHTTLVGPGTTSLTRPPGAVAVTKLGRPVVPSALPGATATIKEVTPAPPVEPRPAPSRPAHKVATRHKPSPATYFPRHSRQARNKGHGRRATRRHGQRTRRIIHGRQTYPNQRQRWQNLDHFIYHDYY